jgi:hypothetical protein
LNAYTHTETETHGLLFWRGRGARESQNTFHCSSVRNISDGTLHWKDKGAWHNEREAKKSESLHAILLPPPCSPTRSFFLDICTRGYVPWILGTHPSFFFYYTHSSTSTTYLFLLLLLTCLDRHFSPFFRNGGYLDCRCGNTSIILGLISRISRYRYSIIGAGWSVFLLLDRREKELLFGLDCTGMGVEFAWG